MAKKAKRRIKRINGKLTVVYVDADTGLTLDNLDGYELYSSDGLGPDAELPKVEEPATTSAPMSTRDRSSNADFWTKSDWATDPKRSKGTGDILGDFRSAAGVLGERIDGVKGTLMNGILTTAGRVMGRDLVADKDNVNAAIGQGVDAAGNAIGGAIENITGQAPGWLGDTIGGFFGGNKEDVPTNTNVSSYAAPPRQAGMIEIPNYPEQIAPSIIDDTQTYSGANLTVGNMAGVNGLIIHHTGGGGDVSGVVNVLEERGFGVQYIMDREGVVHRVVPEGTKVEHLKPGEGPGAGLNNSNVEGIEIIAADDNDLTPAQIASFARFGAWHSQQFGYDPKTNILGHGEVNPHKQETEGQTAKQALLAFLPEAERVIAAYKAGIGTETPAAAAARGVADTAINPKLLAAVSGVKAKQGQQVLVDGQPISPDMVTSKPGILENLTGMADGWLGDAVGDFFKGPPSPKIDSGTPPQITDKTTAPPIPTPVAEPFKARRQEPIVEAPTTALGAVNAMGTGLDPVKKAYLDTINYAEGNPAMNQAFGVNQYFEPGPNHPSTFNSEFNTSAAGKYQWTEPTWKEYAAKAGVTDFSNEEHQDRAAWQLASDNYKARTGGDLYEALLSNDPSAFTANANRWSSLPGGRHPRTEIPELMDKFTEGLTKYNTPVTPTRAPIAPAPKIEQPRTEGFMRPKVSAPINAPITPTSPKLDKPVANPTVSGKTNNTLRDPTITTSKTGGFMPKNDTKPASAKTSSNDPRPTPVTSRPASSSPKINNTPSTSTPIAGKSSIGAKQSRNTPVTPSPSSTKINSTPSTSGSKTSNTGTTKTKTGGSTTKSYNPTGR